MVTASPANLGSVQKTLLLPLWGRAAETKKSNPLLVDPTAARIIESIDYDFSTIATNISFMSQLAWVARSLHIDRSIRKFLEWHPSATIVNLGCGLDTTFERVDNGTLTWYDLDLADVIELRSHYIQPSPRRHFVARSILEDSWMDSLRSADPLLFIAAGVLYYFEESQVRTLLSRLADRFPRVNLCLMFALRKDARSRIRESSVTEGWTPALNSSGDSADRPSSGNGASVLRFWRNTQCFAA